MMDLSRLDFCDEIYIVEKTVEVVVQMKGVSESIRIEALLNPRNGRYKTRAYIQQNVDLQATYQGPRTIKTQVWTSYNLTWTARDTADEALDQALGFLKEHCDPE